MSSQREVSDPGILSSVGPIPKEEVFRTAHASDITQRVFPNRLLDSLLEFLTQRIWGEVQVFAFLTSFQVTLMLLVKGPQFENLGSKT